MFPQYRYIEVKELQFDNAPSAKDVIGPLKWISSIEVEPMNAFADKPTTLEGNVTLRYLTPNLP